MKRRRQKGKPRMRCANPQSWNQFGAALGVETRVTCGLGSPATHSPPALQVNPFEQVG
jgi:hypothetical protein